MGLPPNPKYPIIRIRASSFYVTYPQSWEDVWSIAPQPEPTPFERIVELTAHNVELQAKFDRMQLAYAKNKNRRNSGQMLAEAKQVMNTIQRNKAAINMHLYRLKAKANETHPVS
jgi:hypothetical protein